MDIINFPAPWRLGDGALAAGGHQVRSSLSGGGMPGRWEVGKERRPLLYPPPPSVTLCPAFGYRTSFGVSVFRDFWITKL